MLTDVLYFVLIYTKKGLFQWRPIGDGMNCTFEHVVTVHSVHSNLAKIHSRLPAAMEFWLVCLGIMVCEQ